jgi:STE24 endopeptidase
VRRALPLVIVLGVAAALLWRADLPPSSTPVAAQAVFSQAQIDRAESYRDGSYTIDLASLLVPAVVAALLALRGPGPLRRLRHPAAVAFGFALVIWLAAAPLGAISHARAVDAGLDLRGWPEWSLDEVVALVVRAAAVAIAYLAGLVVLRRLGPLGSALAVVAAVAMFAALQPLAIDPLLVSTRALRPGRLADVVHRLERREDAHPASVTIAEAGTTTTEENAMVDGLGPTVRVTIDDTIASAPTPVLRALVAHELAHVSHHHTLKGVLWFAVLGGPIMLVLLRIVPAWLGPLDGPDGVAGLLAAALLAFTLTLPLQNAISRRYEAEADWAALHATGDGRGAVALERRLALANLSNPNPPGWAVWLLFDHPPVMDRIAVAMAYSRSSGASGVSGRFLMPSRVRHLE